MRRPRGLPVALGLVFGLAALSGVALSSEQKPARLIRIKKADRELWYEERGSVVRRFRVGLGGAPVGDKERQGDSKTPEGEFYVSSKNPRSAFHRFIGLSYPMPRHAERGLDRGLITDVVAEKIRSAARHKRIPPQLTPLGGYVGIHGGGGTSDWTLGCIAVTDEEALWLFERMRLKDPIIIEP